MVELVQLWALVEVLGLLALPLAVTVFRNLPDRGWAFSKLLGVAILAFCVWLPLMCLRFLPYNRLFILGIVIMLAAGAGLAYLSFYADIVRLMRRHRMYIIVCELLFLGMMVLLGCVRSQKPDIRSFEMFMDEGFIASIMRSPHFPPSDMWYAGHSINYYYYAHYTLATLAKLLGQSPSVAFNTGICFFYGATAINLFGVTCNIVGWARRRRLQTLNEGAAAASSYNLLPAIPYGLVSVLMALVLGNLAATQQWWMHHGDPGYQFNWFAPSRVVDNTINEFPAFSFILSCFHAHVLTLAFTILCIGLAFNWLLEQDGKGMRLFGAGRVRYLNLAVSVLLLGELFVMNGWDYPTYMSLTLVCVFIQQCLAHRPVLRLATFWHIGIITFNLLVLSYNFYLPFYLGFISPSRGIGIIPAQWHSQLNEELLIYGLFIFMFISLLIGSALWRPAHDEADNVETTGSAQSRQIRSSFIPEVPLEALPGMENAFQDQDDPLMDAVSVRVKVAEPEGESARAGNAAPQQRRVSAFLWLWLGVGLFFVGCLIALVYLPAYTTFVSCLALAVPGFLLVLYHREDRAHAFTLLLGATAFAIIGGCEIVYLKDVFDGGQALRMNTIFKFYFQAWALLSICSGAGLYFILSCVRGLKLRSVWSRWLWRACVALWTLALIELVLASLVYPILAPYARYGRSNPTPAGLHLAEAYSLDGMAYLANCRLPDCSYDTSADYAAIRWLNANIVGNPVIVEAVGSNPVDIDARVSVFTGLPTLINWPGHEYQWRATWLSDVNHPENQLDFNTRQTDVDKIYTDQNDQVVLDTLAHYNARYIYVGDYERKKYPEANLQRFSAFMQTVYQSRGVSIFKVRGASL